MGITDNLVKSWVSYQTGHPLVKSWGVLPNGTPLGEILGVLPNGTPLGQILGCQDTPELPPMIMMLAFTKVQQTD